MVAKVYGGNKTIHGSGDVNVELNELGEVVAVWFRCMLLPFTQTRVDKIRAENMEDCYKKHRTTSRIEMIIFQDGEVKANV